MYVSVPVHLKVPLVAAGAAVGLVLTYHVFRRFLRSYLFKHYTCIPDLEHLGTPRRGSKLPGTAVVCGGSIAGLFAARVCSDHFAKVVVVEPEAWTFTTEAREPADFETRQVQGSTATYNTLNHKRSRVYQYTAVHLYQVLLLRFARKLFPGFDAIAQSWGLLIQAGNINSQILGAVSRRTRFRMQKHVFTLLGVSLLHLAGIVLFCRGFLLSRRALDRINTCSPVDSSVECTLPATHKRAVVLIIDALRFDFVSPSPPEPRSPYHHNILTLPRELSAKQPDRSFLFHSYVDPPTTTLQRIKGITTGSLSTFVDMGSNFGGSEIKEDSLIVQLMRNRKTTAFMGDDTWLTVYPTAFNISHPFDSFNVEDLHTVDNGVISNIFPLLQRASPQWDVLVGHFLGVDHVGHRVGPDHPSMRQKLAQMDDVLRRIVQLLDDDTLLVVLGDHGMDEKGDHGGDGARETSAALWFYSKGVPLSSPSASGLYPAALTPLTRFVGAEHEHRLVQQIDLVPSLALLLGLPVPFNNLGTVIPELFGARLDAALQVNAQQIWNYLKEYRASASGGELDASWNALSAAWDAAKDSAGRTHFTRLALSSCRALWAQFNGTLMLVGLVLIAVGTALTLFLFLTYGNAASQGSQSKPWRLHTFPWSALPIVLQALSLLSNSFILWEDRMSLFLLISSTAPSFLTALVSPDARLRNRLLGYTMLLALCARLMSLSTVSREEQAPYCHEKQKSYCSATYYATGGSQAPPLLALVLAPLAAAVLPEVLRRMLAISASDRGPMRALLTYLVRGALLCGSACWVLEYFESSASDTSTASTLRLARTIISRTSLLTTMVGGGAFWWFGPLCLDVHRSADGKRVEVLGFANAVGAPFLLFVVLLGGVPLWATTQLTGQIILLLALTALLAWLEVVDSVRDIRALRSPVAIPAQAESTPPVVTFAECAPVALIAQLAFFGTGHQATMQSIQWKAAFLLSRTLQYPWAPILVAINAFGPLLVFGGMGSVLLGAWCAGPRGLAQTERNVTRAALGVMLYFSALLLGAATSTAALRRHLMVWKVFAPRLMLACCALLAVDLGVLLALGLGLQRVLAKVRHVFRNVPGVADGL